MLEALRNDARDRVTSSIDEIRLEEVSAETRNAVRQLCLDFEVIAIGALLIDAKPQTFFTNLCRSAENWRRYLEVRQAKSATDASITFLSPLIGAMVAGNWTLAGAVAALALHGAQEETDYEDEVLHARLLNHLVSGRCRSTPEIEALAARLTEVDQGLFSARLGVMRALLARNRTAFVDAFAAAVGSYGDRIEELAGMLTVPRAKVAPHRHLWLEGLALLRMADAIGLKVADDFRYCPPLARIPMAPLYAGDWVVALPR